MANPGASFFDREGNFSRQKCARMSALLRARIHMRPPRHQRRENAKRPACCLPARRLWNLDLPPPTSHHNVRPRVPGMTTPASSLLLLPVAFSASDRLQLSRPLKSHRRRAINQPARPHRRPKTPRSSRPFQLHLTPDSPIVLSSSPQPPNT